MTTLYSYPSVACLWKPVARHYGLRFETDEALHPDVQKIHDHEVDVTIDWRDLREWAKR